MNKPFFEIYKEIEVSDGMRNAFANVAVTGLRLDRRENRLFIDALSDSHVSSSDIKAMSETLEREAYADAALFVTINLDVNSAGAPGVDNSGEKQKNAWEKIRNEMKSGAITESELIEKCVSFRGGGKETADMAEPPAEKDPDSFYMGEAARAQTRIAESSKESPKSKSKSAVAPAAGTGKRARRGSRKTEEGMIYGRNFSDQPTPITDITEGIGELAIKGKIFSLEARQIKGERAIITFCVTDNQDSISCKIFCAAADAVKITDAGLAEGNFVSVKGRASHDDYTGEVTITSISGIRPEQDSETGRTDNAPVKRVELHCHTKMSDMDGVSDVRDIIKRAKKWGHSAIAVTDHGVVQAFPDAFHEAPPDGDFKVIYGMEAYIVDDLNMAVENPKGQSLSGKYCVFDLETTGLSAARDDIIEIGATKVENGVITDSFSTFVNPGRPIPYEIVKLTSITDDMVADAPKISEALPEFAKFFEGCAMVAHNAEFDMSFIMRDLGRLGMPCPETVVDTLGLSRMFIGGRKRYTLDAVAKILGVPLPHHHRAVDDARCTAEIFLKLLETAREKGITDLAGIQSFSGSSEEAIGRMPYNHAVILVKNEQGRLNLYKMVSASHLKYFYNKRPRIPKSMLAGMREGLIIGSACEAGELYQALIRGRSEKKLKSIVSFYDYLEIQPVANNEFMIENRRYPVRSRDDIINLNKRVVELGEKYGKPIAATGDVHFLDPEDAIYREIITSAMTKGKPHPPQPPLYLRTTEEMLAEFSYLGEKKAYEVVVENTNKIADMCEHVAPVRPDKCPPVIENSDVILRETCVSRAEEIYGTPLPERVSERLTKELDSIISNGFAVMYIIAQKLVKKSNEDGYLVGSRGSVGSSLAATMAGITEVNPLSPHYYCTNCRYSNFDSDDVKGYSAGCDMPDKMCPKCGKPLRKDGFDIPFETFLGFKGNKEPDIDLNFSGEYQSRAHKYTEEIFGKGQTYRAGTIGTMKDRTAFGFVKNYFEERKIHKRKCEIDRIIKGCVGVRRTTGQHPGGIIVVPHGEDINSFTPIQHPADDMTSDIVTTHFDYHSIDHNLLKLDILGHDDPTMIRMLQVLTGEDPLSIPFDDADVMSLFAGTQALGITPSDIRGCPLGTLGVPEFGTDFAMQMLIETKPKHFSDLVRIAGLAHGTDVWLNNAQELIKSGTADISTAICTRDDIMTYLISKGLDREESFDIMEQVRKGKVAGGKCKKWDEYKKHMREHDVPGWYITSCETIKYMFPKAHAVAYVMMAWRIAWFKIFRPLEYYCAFFSIRATGFDYELMCLGRGELEKNMDEYKSRWDSLSKAELDVYKDMRIVQEMYARGFAFEKIDLEKAEPHKFKITENKKIMPAIDSLSGIGDKAAESVSAAARAGEFLSYDDFKERTGVSAASVELLRSLGIIGGMTQSNQISLFDL